MSNVKSSLSILGKSDDRLPEYPKGRFKLNEIDRSYELSSQNKTRFTKLMDSSSLSAHSGVPRGPAPNIEKTTTVRYRGKRYDQVSTTKASILQSDEQMMRREERKRLIKRSNDRLRMLDAMSKERQAKLQADL